MIKTNLSSGEIQDLINKYNSEFKKLEFQTAEVKMTLLGLENLMKDVNSREKASFAKVKIKKTAFVKSAAKRGRKSIAKAKEKAIAETKPKSKKVKIKKAITVKPKKAAVQKKAIIKSPKTIVKTKKTELKKKAVSKPPKASVKSNSAASENKGYKLSEWDTFVIQSIEQSGKVLITSEIIDQVKNKMTSVGKKTNDKEIKNKVTRSLQKLVNRRGDLSKVSFKGKGFAYALPNWLVSKGKIAPEYIR